MEMRRKHFHFGGNAMEKRFRFEENAQLALVGFYSVDLDARVASNERNGGTSARRREERFVHKLINGCTVHLMPLLFKQVQRPWGPH
jgi:hypothetical protein